VNGEGNVNEDSKSNYIYCQACEPEVSDELTDLEKKWGVGPLSVDGQKLILEYGDGDGDGTPVVIEYYAYPRDTEPPTGVKNNCFGEGGTLVAGPEGAPAIGPDQTAVEKTPTGFDIMASAPSLGQTELDIRCNSAIRAFEGYDGKTDPGGFVFSQLAVKYTFNLDGKVEITNAVVFNENGTEEEIEKQMYYGIDAYRCNSDGVPVGRCSCVCACR
jgi:hypothetical protein